MKILILANSSLGFRNSFYANSTRLNRLSFHEIEKGRIDTFYHPADFYAHNLRLLGHDAQVVVINDYYLQSAWARENAYKHSSRHEYDLIWRRHIVPWLKKTKSRKWIYEILGEQVKHFKPDVIYNTSIGVVDRDFLIEIKNKYPKIHVVGQHAALPLDGYKDWTCYDLLISSFEPTIQWLNKMGKKTAFVKLGFEPYVLSGLAKQKRYDITFVGAFHKIHGSRQDFLEKLCEHFDIHVWAPIINSNDASPLLKNYHGVAYGRDMFEILSSSRITLNHHGDVLPYANNMRLYEATGVGTFLLTDYKDNLSELFDLDTEIVAYKSLDDCVELIKYFLKNEDEKERIAQAGQKRTLRDHTYYQRMCEVSSILTQLER